MSKGRPDCYSAKGRSNPSPGVTKVVMPSANEEETRREGALQQVVLVDDVKGMVEVVVQGEVFFLLLLPACGVY